jgi:hypothetical protein
MASPAFLVEKLPVQIRLFFMVNIRGTIHSFAA